MQTHENILSGSPSIIKVLHSYIMIINLQISGFISLTVPVKNRLKNYKCLYELFSGIPIRTTLDNSTTVQYAGLITQLTSKARSTVRDIDPQNDLTFLRIRSKKHEIMVAPGMCTARLFYYMSLTSYT